MRARTRWWLALAGAGIAATGLTIVDPRGDAVRAWLAYGAVAAACAALLVAALGSVGRGAPAGVLAAVLVALGLRLAVGSLLIRVLPVLGYPTNSQQAGYVYEDAYKRDTDAWNISRMQDPGPGLAAARTTSDQYLGMVTFSAGLYRMVSPDAHRPLLMVELAALASALGVLFTWAFGRAAMGDRVAGLAAWGMALYPESVLLGSSQMREPFLIALYAMGFYGYAIERQSQRRSGLAWMAAAFLIALPLSPPFALGLLVALLGAWLWEGRSKLKGRWLALAVAGCLALAGLFLMVRAWSSIGDLSGLGVDALVGWWTHATDAWRTSLLIEGSPIIGFFLKMFPAWAQMPVITGLRAAPAASAGSPGGCVQPRVVDDRCVAGRGLDRTDPVPDRSPAAPRAAPEVARDPGLPAGDRDSSARWRRRCAPVHCSGTTRATGPSCSPRRCSWLPGPGWRVGRHTVRGWDEWR